MAHLIESMAYVGEAPWHQLGNALPQRQPIAVWAAKAGALGSIKTFNEQKVLYRSDIGFASTRSPIRRVRASISACA